METEVWKPVVGYEGLYEVSNLGRVKSLRYCKEKILKISRNKFYKNIILKINWLRKNFLVHRLVALHFIDNLDNLSCVLHKKEDLDGNGFLYNWADNLYWWTQKDNMQDCFKKWRWNNHFKLNHPTKWKFWKDNHNSKKINQYTKDWEFIREWYSMADVKRELWINESLISNCCNGIRKTAGGFSWSFISLLS